MKNRLKYLLLSGIMVISSVAPMMRPELIAHAEGEEELPQEAAPQPPAPQPPAPPAPEPPAPQPPEPTPPPQDPPQVPDAVPPADNNGNSGGENNTVTPEDGNQTDGADAGSQDGNRDSNGVDTTPEIEGQPAESESTEQTESESNSETAPATDTEAEKETEKETETEDPALIYEQITGEPIYVSGTYPSGNITENTNRIYDFLREKLGLNHAAACGILANIQCEANFAPTMVGDGGSSYGICQWHEGRFANLVNFCRSTGLDFHTLDGQLAYLQMDLNGYFAGVYQYMLQVPDTAAGAYQAGYYWCMNYEVPAHTEYNSQLRGELAQHEYYPKTLGSPKKAEKLEIEILVDNALETDVHMVMSGVFGNEVIEHELFLMMASSKEEMCIPKR